MRSDTLDSRYPAGEIGPSPDFRVRINGAPVFVYTCPVASYAVVSADGTLDVEVEVLFPFQEVTVRPLRLGVPTEADGGQVRFRLDAPQKVSVEFDGDLERPLFLFVQPPETDAPSRDDPRVRYFEGGAVHDAGEIRLAAGETAYLEAGAVVRGWIVADGADGVSIRGRGILDGSVWREDESRRRQAILIARSQGVTIEGVTLVDGGSWNVVPIACNDVVIRDLNIITINCTGDGIDVVGSENVTIENCFIRSNDDCIALKATGYQREAGCRDVRHIRASGCVLWNAHCGNAIEIGYETRCDEITDVVFRDMDVIHSEFEGWQSGGTFTIHNGDRALVHNIRYEDIRVEDSREKLIDIKILHSVYSRDEERGRVRDIHFRDIQVVGGLFPVSIVQGFDGHHLIEAVTVEGLTVHGQPIGSANEARMVVEFAKGIQFQRQQDNQS